MKRLQAIVFLCIAFVVAGCVAVAPAGKKFTTGSETGLVVVSFVDRALLTPQGGAIALSDTAGKKQWIIFAGKGDEAIQPSNGKGSIYYGAAELAPGTYTVSNWRLHNSSGGDSVSAPNVPLKFEVVKGKAIYLGSFNVLRFAENAQFRDSFEFDRPNIAKYLPHLTDIALENKSFATDWWPLPGATEMKKIGAVAPNPEK